MSVGDQGWEAFASSVAAQAAEMIETRLRDDPSTKRVVSEIESSSLPRATKRAMCAQVEAAGKERRLLELRVLADALIESFRGVGLQLEGRPLKRRVRRKSSGSLASSSSKAAGGPQKSGPDGEASIEDVDGRSEGKNNEL